MAGTKFGDSSDPAFEDALLAAAAVTPPVAAATAIIDQGEELLEAGNDAAKFVGGALDDIFGGGDDEVPPGTSTFPVDPNAPTYTPEEYAAQREAALEARRAEVDMDERIDAAKEGKVQDANAEAGGIYQDPRYEDLSDHAPHTQVDDTLDLESGIAGAGASAGAVGAPDGAYEPVSSSEPHTGIGFIPEGADVGAPDNVFEPVSESAPHTTVGTGDLGAPDGAFEPVSDSELHTSVGGADLGAPDGAFEPVSDSELHTSVGGADLGAPDGAYEPVSASDPHTSVGFVPTGDDLPTVDGAQTEVPFGSDVQLNPQPIPPGMGADIGEPVADADAAAPSTTDSSIVIVGGTEAPVFSDVATASAEAPVVADIEVAEVPMEDVASTIAVGLDGPSFSAADTLDAPIEMSIEEEAIDG